LGDEGKNGWKEKVEGEGWKDGRMKAGDRSLGGTIWTRSKEIQKEFKENSKRKFKDKFRRIKESNQRSKESNWFIGRWKERRMHERRRRKVKKRKMIILFLQKKQRKKKTRKTNDSLDFLLDSYDSRNPRLRGWEWMEGEGGTIWIGPKEN
jgi:hypothetical protein